MQVQELFAGLDGELSVACNEVNVCTIMCTADDKYTFRKAFGKKMDVAVPSACEISLGNRVHTTTVIGNVEICIIHLAINW